jgi:SAM-dependent methyltransferase
MGEDRSDNYVLRGGDEGAQRLRLLAHVAWPTTKALLHRVGIRTGMLALDVGCGIGAIAHKIARRVGPGGQVVGIDMDERCVELARQEALQHPLAPVFRAESVRDLREVGAFDLVYSRFLLSHLSEPEKAVERMAAAARTGGCVVVEDVDFAGHFCYPACAAFDRYVNLYQRAVKLKGGDANLGPRLLGLLLDAGLQQVRVSVVQPAFRKGPGKRLAQVTLEHIREKVVAGGLATASEIDTLVAELDRFAHNPRTIVSLPRIFQVWGRK